MARSPLGLYLRALGIGAISGLRSLTAPALVSYLASQQRSSALDASPLKSLASKETAGVLCVLAAGELVADKLPVTPNRTVPGSVVFRALSGALVGATICAEEGESPAAGAIFGMLGAVGATYAAYYLRKAADRETGLPDTIVALVEDAIAIGGGLSLLRR